MHSRRSRSYICIRCFYDMPSKFTFWPLTVAMVLTIVHRMLVLQTPAVVKALVVVCQPTDPRIVCSADRTSGHPCGVHTYYTVEFWAILWSCDLQHTLIVRWNRRKDMIYYNEWWMHEFTHTITLPNESSFSFQLLRSKLASYLFATRILGWKYENLHKYAIRQWSLFII